MEIESLKREELQNILFQLEQALCNHHQWYSSVIRSLICRLPSDRHDISHGSNISPLDYDNFSISLEKMRLEIAALQRELNETLHNRYALTGAINRVNMLPLLRHDKLICLSCV